MNYWKIFCMGDAVVLRRSMIVPEEIIKYWLGHSAGADITSRYSKTLADDRILRRKLADEIGLGFALPTQEAP